MYIFRTPAKTIRLGKMHIKSFTKFSEKYRCWSLFLNKVAGIRLQLY